MEHLSQQQYVTVEGIDNSNARALVVKLINVVLTVLQVILLLTATAAGILMPFLKTRYLMNRSLTFGTYISFYYFHILSLFQGSSAYNSYIYFIYNLHCKSVA